MSATAPAIPAIVLAGRNGLSVVRSLGRAGVPVYVPGAHANIRLTAASEEGGGS